MAVDNTVHWGAAEVVETEDVADGIRRIVLAPDRPVHARPGTHIDLRLTAPVDGIDRSLTRSYSVVRSEDNGARLTISVHLAPASRGGSKRMHALEVGERLQVTSPLQNFPLGVGAARYVLLAGGIGITAIMAMGETLKSRGADYRFILVGRSRSVLPYLDELAALHGDRFELHVDDEGTGLDVSALVQHVATDPAAMRTELYQCGPIGLLSAVRRAWAAAELPPANLRFETFGSSGSWEPQEFIVRIPQLNRDVTVPADSTALEALQAEGLTPMFDCRKGECGLCLVKVLDVEGRIDHRDVFLDDEQKSAEDRLCLCVSRVAVPSHEIPDDPGLPEQTEAVRTGVLSVELP